MCKESPEHGKIDNVRPSWPEEPCLDKNWLSLIIDRWTFRYMNEILDRGEAATKEQHHLTYDDLFPVPSTMRAEFLSREFRSRYLQYRDNQERQLIKTLWKMAAPTFIPAGVCQLITVACQVALPLLVRELLQVLEENPKQEVISEGLPYALALFLTSVLNAFGNHRHRHLAMKSGIVMRAALINVLYQHVLQLTPEGRSGLTSGEVTNLLAVDTQKLYEVAQEGHLVWSLPLTVILVTYFLVRTLGPSALVGVGVLVLFVPIVERVSAAMMAIRSRRVKYTDQRIEISTAMLQGIKVTKLNNYEENYRERVEKVREAELVVLQKEMAVWATTLMMMVVSPVLATAAAFTTYVLTGDDHILTAAKVFAVLLLFAALRFPINNAGRLIGKASQALSAVSRIKPFLERETREPTDKSVLTTEDDEPLLSLKNAGFEIPSIGNDTGRGSLHMSLTGGGGGAFSVGRVESHVKRGEVLAVCGPVGSGKTTFVSGILAELPAMVGTEMTIRGKIAFVPQTPFVLNATLRDNILFGEPYDSKLYEKILDVCNLRQDIEQLGEAGDMTEIGERGVTLSGGQKQRVSLARAAYSQPDVVILDDPLSALDAGTAKIVFERLIKSHDAFLSNAAVILVTHASHFLHKVDRILLIVDGSNKFIGTWNELLVFEPKDKQTIRAVEFMRSSIHDNDDSKKKEGQKQGISLDENSGNQDNLRDGKLMSVEEREHGLSSILVWLLWFRRAGGVWFLFFQILFMAIDRFAYVAVEFWLATWVRGADKPVEMLGIRFEPQTNGVDAQYKYLLVYALILVISITATLIRSEWAVTGGVRAAKRVFHSMLARVLHAPMSYFETTPMGRIINRFTYDMEVIDVLLTQIMSVFLISCSWYVAGVAVMVTILPWMGIAILPVTCAYYYLLLHYRRTGADLQRLDAVARSPIQAMISEGLDGAASIRIFRQERNFLNRFYKAVDVNSSALLCFISSQRWLGLRIELLGSLIVLTSAVLVISLNQVWELDPGAVGLLILWAGNFTITLGFMVDSFSDVEAHITAIERVDAMTSVPQEKDMVTDAAHAVPESWPSKGNVEFQDVCLRYRPGLPLALNQLSFVVAPGQRCGVVGRTGAGKSSLTVALFRIVELDSGRILLDGVDLACLGLSDVRGRGMTIIPQDPFLTGTTLRECLDPFGAKDDDEILEALKTVRLAGEGAEVEALDTPVQEGGSNYSVGERQLLNIASALLSQPRVLVLDEATASIDYETDSFVQQMLRTRFTNTTLITVAHRLNTIMDYDTILVMDEGRAAEMGQPKDLLLNETSLFSQLVDATGPESSKALRKMVTN